MIRRARNERRAACNPPVPPRVKGSFRCSIYPEERQRIAEVDLAHADTTEAEAFYNRNPPEPRRLRGAYDLIPDAVRPNLAVAASFDILNA